MVPVLQQWTLAPVSALVVPCDFLRGRSWMWHCPWAAPLVASLPLSALSSRCVGLCVCPVRLRCVAEVNELTYVQ